jgi:hypothetical protein
VQRRKDDGRTPMSGSTSLKCGCVSALLAPSPSPAVDSPRCDLWL